MLFTAMVLVVKPPVRRRLDFEHHIDVEEVNNDEEFQCGQRSPLMSLEGPLNDGRCSIGGWLTSRVTEDTDVAGRGFERRKMLNWWMVDVTGHRRYRVDVAVTLHGMPRRNGNLRCRIVWDYVCREGILSTEMSPNTYDSIITPEMDMLTRLPHEILEIILNMLPVEGAVSLSAICF